MTVVQRSAPWIMPRITAPLERDAGCSGWSMKVFRPLGLPECR